MHRIKDIEENILSVVGEGEILIIVPPFGSINDSSLGPHVLQALAGREGYKTDVLYLNMLLASILGVDHYEEIFAVPRYWMLGERLFARSAYDMPPLGTGTEYCDDTAMATMGTTDCPEIYHEVRQRFDRELFLKTEQVCRAFIDEVTSVIASLNYKIVGCTATMDQINCSIALLAGVKEQVPETITILGGGHCKEEMAAGTLSLSEAVDYVFEGESDTSFVHFLRDFSMGQLPPRHTVIPGEPLQDLDSLPLTDYGIFFNQYARFLGDMGDRKIRVWYETSRGCWWAEVSKCTFCSENPITYRKKSIEKVLADIKIIKKSLGDRMLYMADSIMSVSYYKELLPHLGDTDLFPQLGFLLKANLKLQHMVDLKRANVNAILPGIETFSTRLLKMMKKGVTGRQNILFLRNTKSIGLFTDWLLLHAFPFDRVEDYQEILELLPLMRHLQPPRKFESMVLMRFSPYLDDQEEYGISNVRPWAVVSHVYPEWADREKLAIYFAGEYSCGIHQQPEIIQQLAQQVEIWKKVWKKTTLAMGRFMDAFTVYDNRDIHQEPKTHMMGFQQAKDIMTSRRYDESEHLKWALDNKLGVLSDSWYVPLVTASSELLLEFEKK